MKNILFIDFLFICLLIIGVALFRIRERARLANSICAIVMLGAMGLTLYRYPIKEPALVITTLLLASLVGVAVAVRVDMIQIPSMVAFQNGAGGLASVMVSLIELMRGATLPSVGKAFGLLALVVGAVTFSGSMIACGKLSGTLKSLPSRSKQHLLLWVVVPAILVFAGRAYVEAGSVYSLVLLGILSGVLGINLSLRIGGADMPVWISFLNSFSGLAAAFCGIITQNRLLIACGAMVGASGLILTLAMCRAMNRHLLKVFAGIKAAEAPDTAGDGECEAPEAFDEPSLEDALSQAIKAIQDAERIVVIPGYGMALAQAQFEVVELTDRLERLGKEIVFAIHPVAGRMPGHMNVVLAEAGVDYDKLLEMDEVNPTFEQTDLALVVGACDVVNPAAITKENTPIYGMPVLLADKARRVVVCNLDKKPGYSGVENPLYTNPKTIFLMGDAKANFQRLLEDMD